jgi:hypothetical protein
VGDGNNIRIWEDMWLNREGARTPVTPKGQCLLTHVAELINLITNDWDVKLVKQTFWEMDVQIILSTPIRSEFEDFPAWFHDNKGVFSVRSPYKIYVRQRDASIPSSSGGLIESSFWKKLWDLPCLPKVQQFIWHLTHNSLPLRVNMARRGIKCDTLCACCKRLDEDGSHVFLKCKDSKEAWRGIGSGEMCDRISTYEHAYEVIQEILAALEYK